MVLWFSMGMRAAKLKFSSFNPSKERDLEVGALVKIKWGDQGGMCESSQLPSSKDSDGYPDLIGVVTKGFGHGVKLNGKGTHCVFVINVKWFTHCMTNNTVTSQARCGFRPTA